MSVGICQRCRRDHNAPPAQGVAGCTVDGCDIIAHVAAQFCPHPSGPRFGTSVAPADWAAVPVVQVGVPQPQPAPQEPQEPIEIRGPALWARLHKRPLEWPGGDDTAWLQQFSRDVGCGSCASHWREWAQFNAPDFSSAAAYFEWSWRGHSHVNAALNKPAVLLDEAKREWGY